MKVLKKLAIITSHPIQYNAPLFQLLHSRKQIDIRVFYTWGEEVLKDKFDPGFGKTVEWDIPLLEGYPFVFVDNSAGEPGSHHFTGIVNPGLVAMIKEWQADALLVYGWAFKSHLHLLRYFHNKLPIYFRGDSVSMKPRTFYKKFLRNQFLRWVYRHIDIALYVGTQNKRYYQELGLKDHQLVFAPHAIDNKRFSSPGQNFTGTINWKEKLGIRRDDLLVLYAGKLDRNKNVSLLLEAFSSLKDGRVHLLVAGSGDQETELKKNYVGGNIHFIPFQNQSVMPGLYHAVNLFVLPSLSETWGLAINEAMACGKAVLVSNACGAATDLVNPGMNGFTFINNSLEDLCAKLEILLGPACDLEKMGEASQQIISSWNFESTCEKLEKLVNNSVNDLNRTARAK